MTDPEIPTTYLEACSLEAKRRDREGIAIVIEDIVETMMREWPELCSDYTHNSMRATLRRGAKQVVAPPVARQESLPGFPDVPFRISIPIEGGYVYRIASAATRTELRAHLELLTEQCKNDQERRDAYAEALAEVENILDQYGVERLCDVPDYVVLNGEDDPFKDAA